MVKKLMESLKKDPKPQSRRRDGSVARTKKILRQLSKLMINLRLKWFKKLIRKIIL